MEKSIHLDQIVWICKVWSCMNFSLSGTYAVRLVVLWYCLCVQKSLCSIYIWSKGVLDVVTTTLSKAHWVFKLIVNSSLHARAGILIRLSSSLYCKSEHCNFSFSKRGIWFSTYSSVALRHGQMITEEQTGGRAQLSSVRSRWKLHPTKFQFIY